MTIDLEVPAPVRPPMVTRALLLRFVSIIGSASGFYLLLSVVPLYAKASGGGDTAAGIASGALLLASVAGELAAPRVIARLGYRRALTAGLVMLGAPALALTLSGSLEWIVAISIVRGLGFAVAVVAGGALTASLIPAERRGEGLALVGVVGGVPSLVALPLGVWLAERLGYGPASVAAAVVTLATVAAVPGLPDREPGSGRSAGVVAGLRTPALFRPAIVFAATTLAAGIVVTFLPLAVPGNGTGLVTLALFLQPAASTAARWVAGRHGDRHGAARLVLPGLLVSAAGMLLTALTQNPAAVIAGVTVFGIGFGVAQNATLTLMYSRVSTPGYGMVSALWNFAYDAGMGAGALGFGILAGRTGYPLAFVITAALMLTTLPAATRNRT